jgi:hypothetical protein
MNVKGTLTAMCDVTGDGLWHPYMRIDQGYKTYEAAMRAGQKLIGRRVHGTTKSKRRKVNASEP